MLCFVWTWSCQGQPGINGRPGIEGLEVIRHAHIYKSHDHIGCIFLLQLYRFQQIKEKVKLCSPVKVVLPVVLCVYCTQFFIKVTITTKVFLYRDELATKGTRFVLL